MGRTPGATNRTPRELKAAAAAQMKEAKLKQKIADQRRQLEAKKAKKAK
jgi:hypothetical protein